MTYQKKTALEGFLPETTDEGVSEKRRTHLPDEPSVSALDEEH
jgi:hypothetical protein